MQLYTYFRSSASWRVRIALALKGLSPAQQFVHLLTAGGQQNTAAFRGKSPLDAYPLLQRAEAAALALPAFRDTAPERQPDAF
ncbi:MAG: glutathione S-transferase N-terminal domain-containing protein [Acetobacteraceae bacterium]|jgi:glutathione S-transferase